jgi:alpha-methylacyl-CoA racemase
MAHGPLDGVRVLDLTRLLPGNYATLVMAALGADVIKVEDRGAGDYIRGYGTQVDGASALHHNVNRGKRSIALDLKDDTDRASFEELIGTSQVLLDSFRPGTLERLGYPSKRLHELRPDLVICSITGFGLDGPLAAAPGHDLNFLAWSGVVDRLGEALGAPVVPVIPIADLLAGMMCAMFTMPYIRQAERTGVGVVIDTPMAEAVALLPTSLMAELLAGVPVGPRGHFRLGGGLASYSLYEVLDGHVAVVAQEPRFWSDLVEVAGLAELAESQRDPAAQEAIRARLAAFFAPLTRADAVAAFDGHEGVVTSVNSYEEMLNSPHALARGYLDPKGAHAVPVVSLPVTVDGQRLAIERRAPGQGQDAEEIVRELGESPFEPYGRSSDE